MVTLELFHGPDHGRAIALDDRNKISGIEPP